MTAAPALFASAFAPHVGGVEELVRQLAIEQQALGLSPTVFTNRYPKSLAAREVIDGIPVRRVAFRVPGAHWRHLAGWTTYAAAAHLGVARDLRSLRSDLVHVQCVSSNASYALRASRSLRLPLVVTMQGELSMDASAVYERSSYLRRLWRRSLDAADAVTACSQFVLDEAEEAYGRSLGPQATVVPNGVRVAEYDSAPGDASGPPYLLGIGRMVAQKGFDVLIDAFCEVADAYPDLRLVLAGDGPSRASLEQRARDAGLAGRIEFCGRVKHDRAIELFQGAELFVLPSRHEPQGIVVLEAMAARTAVVAAAVGGVPETVADGENGLLFTGGDPAALAEAASRLLGDSTLREACVAAGRITAEAHDWSEITRRYLAAYAQATA